LADHARSVRRAAVPVRFIAYPHGSLKYLEQKYGLEPYTPRHLGVLVKQGRFPKPIQISPRRNADTDQQLDQYAEGLIAQTDAAE
jgi:hypothetical protein